MRTTQYLSEKIRVENVFYCLEIKKKLISNNRRILNFFIYYTVLNLDKLKLKEPEKTYELTNCISKLKPVI